MRVVSFTILFVWYVFTYCRLTRNMKRCHNYEYDKNWKVRWANFYAQSFFAVLFFLDSIEVYNDEKTNDIKLKEF